MSENNKILTPGPGNTLFNQHGKTIIPPNGWLFLPAGDAGITRKVTSQGQYLRVQKKKGRRTISLGIWAPEAIIRQAREEMTAIRKTDAYQKRQEYTVKRRNKKQVQYKGEFLQAVEKFLNFHEKHSDTQKEIANAVTSHAIPVGSGTVARTSTISLEERAARAGIAWMRHQTTAYDNLSIKRIKGERRKVRRMLAEQSTSILEKYRKGLPADKHCPLQKVLKKQEGTNASKK